MNTKSKNVNCYIKKLKNIACVALRDDNFEKAISAIDSCAGIQYEWNQQYTDKQLEEYIEKIARKLICPSFDKKDISEKTVLFYDGFGLDTRGLALVYLKALGELGYKILYVTRKGAMNKQAILEAVLRPYDVEWLYYDVDNFTVQIECIQSIFNQYKPAVAFHYTWPYDVVAAIVFSVYKGIVKRYLINLTDHAFWIGTEAIDYCIEFRNLGASISNTYRNIGKDRLVILPYYPYIEKGIEFQGFPFSAEGKKVVFSGGSLYKTFGDKEDTYYKIVDEILDINPDVLFLYAGSGDTQKLDRLIEKYPQRVFFISERTDLYEIMRHCDLYLSTYPLAGGVMTQFAAVAGRIPITLSPSDGIFDEVLIDQERRNIEYSNKDELLIDVNKLLADTEYRKEREMLLEGAVITEDEFVTQLDNILKNNESKYIVNIRECKMNTLHEEYVRRFDLRNKPRIYIAQKRKKSLLFEFPLLFLKQVAINVAQKMYK